MSTPATVEDLHRLPAEDVKQILEGPARESVAVLDVRDADELADGAIAGHTHLASSKFDDPAEIDALLDGELKGKDKVIVHCMHSQKRGPACALKLAERIEARKAAGGGEGGSAPAVVVLDKGYHGFASLFGESELIVKKVAQQKE
jgi:Cdc25 family phosphatase